MRASEETGDAREAALVLAGQALRARGYAFVTVTPASHARVLARDPGAVARDLRDVFGWSRPFRPEVLGPALFEPLAAAGWLRQEGTLWRSRVRFSTAGPLLLVHSAHPTDAGDAVFLGPDTYRFLALVQRTVARPGRLVDVGCGTGAAGLLLGARAREVVLADVTDSALSFARVNARLAAAAEDVTVVRSDVLDGVEGELDAIIANPPYLVDPARRTYRDGGPNGTALAVRIVREGLDRLAPGGRLVLYTGTPVVRGQSVLAGELAPVLARDDVTHAWEELDPDVFGEELARPAYREAERIAVVALVARRVG